MTRLPIDAQPGDRFIYGNSTDVLGVVVEVVSGQSLDEFFAERIFEPLGMTDTHFFLPMEKAPRLSAVYGVAETGLRRGEGDTLDGQGHFVHGPRRAHAGGSGLVSSAKDFGLFMQMLLNGGSLDGTRILGPRTVKLMRTNHVGELFAAAVPGREGFGFGLGFAILLDPGATSHLGSPGSFGFAGAYYTAYWMDPEEDLAALIMTQLRPPNDHTLHSRFWNLVYQAIVAPVPEHGSAIAGSLCNAD
jgi:CubicO group peptidase (beta-lactamase class C family)